MDRHWLAGELFKMDIMPPPISEDLRASFLNFTCDLEVVGEVLETFEEDDEAARIVRDRLCSWARVWSGWHPEPEYRPFYGAVAGAAEAGDWNGVSQLCQALMEIEERRLEQ